MNATLRELSERYVAALRAHLAEGPHASLTPATDLGREALSMDLVPPDLALIHEEALAALVSAEQTPRDGNETIRRAGLFFRRALAPLGEAPGAASQPNAPAEQAEPRTRAAELNAVKRRLLRETARRKAAESALKEDRRLYAKLLGDSRIMQKQLRQLSHEILRAQEEERKRISRELHDEISQILTGINVRLAALRIESTANARDISRKIAGTQRLVEKSVATVHRFARELRPTMLDDLGLIPALTTYMKDVRKRTGLRIHLTVPKAETIESVDSLKRTVLYRVAQEALRNVTKHAQATLVNVSVQVDSDRIRLEVTDNGKSFPVQRFLASKRRKCLGLIGMRERAEMVGGTFDIESAPGSGTTVRVCIPLPNGAGE